MHGLKILDDFEVLDDVKVFNGLNLLDQLRMFNSPDVLDINNVLVDLCFKVYDQLLSNGLTD